MAHPLLIPWGYYGTLFHISYMINKPARLPMCETSTHFSGCWYWRLQFLFCIGSEVDIFLKLFVKPCKDKAILLLSIECERSKSKGTLIWPAFLLIPIIPILFGMDNYLANLDLLKSQWYSYWTQVTLFYSIFFPPLIGSYCGFLWRYENFIIAGIPCCLCQSPTQQFIWRNSLWYACLQFWRSFGF